MTELTFTLQIFIAMILGGVLGFQREYWGRAAGVRTYALVASGSALFTILSVAFFGTDTAGVAAGIVTGIGFLGAGTILHHKDHVEGLTTAAGLWMVAAVGMAIGLGYYLLAVNATALILVVLGLNDKKLMKKAIAKKR